MFIDSFHFQPPAIVQVASEEAFDLGALWDVTGWTFVIPMLAGNQPFMGNTPLIVLDQDGNEIEVGEDSYKVPGLLEYKNPDYFIIMDEHAFLASGYKLALKGKSKEVILGIASYTEEKEIMNEFQHNNTSGSPSVLNFEKVKTEGILLFGSSPVASFKTEVNDINRHDLRVEVDVSSEDLKIPVKPLGPTVSFSDVKSPLLNEAIVYLYSRGIISGYPDGRKACSSMMMK